MQNYDWGSRTTLSRLIGRPASGDPEAEMWMGAHTKAPSIALVNSERVPLDRLIVDHPNETLGRLAGEKELPFLFKILALSRPVSLQVHPNRVCAERGFETEERRGVPIDAPNRSYRDRRHKPEILMALEPMVVLCGFMAERKIQDAMFAAGVGDLIAPVRQLLRFVLTLNKDDGARLHQRLVEGADPSTPTGSLLRILASHYPGDPTVIAALLLNMVELSPGQALYIPPGQLHTFVSGSGIELMANSDNVLRAGLTAKHLDERELLLTGDLSYRSPSIILSRSDKMSETIYPTPADEFQLSVINLHLGGSFSTESGPEILLLLGEEAHIEWSDRALDLRRGEVVFVPGTVKEYYAKGVGRLYRARTMATTQGSQNI